MRNTKRSMRVFVYATALCFVFLHPLVVHASQDLTVAPAVIDEKGKPRDILKETVVLTNTSDHVIDVFPTVKDVNTENGQQTFDRAQNAQELSDSLANWIELSRGVIKLGPGEQKEVPFVIRLNPNAVAAQYHAQISFGTGATRDEAEAAPPLATVAVNLEVTADIKEIMQLNSFTADSVVFTGDDVLFNYKLQNIGNQELAPKGEIRIYDRKGREVAAIDVNKDGKIVSPDQVAQLASVWSAVSGFGKYKALLNVSYGKGQTASVQDTVFFWIIPWKQLFGLLVVSLVAIIIMALYFHRWLEERHLGKLAHAGLLKPDALATVQHPTMAQSGTHQKSRSIFSVFKKSTPTELSLAGSIAQQSVPIPAPHILAPTPSASVQSVVSPSISGQGGEHTIDLKLIRPTQVAPSVAEPAPTHQNIEQGPVINLRKQK